MTKKLVVVHAGQTFTRMTNRTYTHVILAKRDFTQDQARSIQEAVYSARLNYPYYVGEANPATRKHGHNEVTLERFIKIAAMTVEQYVQQCTDNAIAYTDADRDKGPYDRFGALAWAGRLDLANKEAERARKNGFIDVIIVPVPPVV